MEQDPNNFNQNDFNTQGSNGLYDNQSINNDYQTQNVENNFQQSNSSQNYDQSTNRINEKDKKSNNKIILIIVVILILLVVALVIYFVFGKNKGNNGNDSLNSNTNVNENQNNTLSKNEDKDSIKDLSNWGVQESIMAENEKGLVRARIKFPTLSGVNLGTGKIAYQKDKTLVILDAQIIDDSPEINNETILPAYFEQTKKIIDQYRRSNYSNFDFSIDNKQEININDYAMVKYTGTHTFMLNGKSEKINFVAYSTKLKENGACIYWMVLDESEDQSLSSTIDQYATNMAYTLHEQ